MRDLKKLTIWRSGLDLTKAVYRITKKLPEDEKFGLTSQMRRASVSIPSNIAEGCSRNSDIEYKRFLEIAIGSAFELETQLIIAHEIEYFDSVEFDKIHAAVISLQKQINSLINRLKGR